MTSDITLPAHPQVQSGIFGRDLNLASPDKRGVFWSSTDRHHRKRLAEGEMIDVFVIKRLSLLTCSVLEDAPFSDEKDNIPL